MGKVAYITKIPDDQLAVIKHARKSLLFYNDKTWVKNNDQSLFDVTMGSYDGAEICELVGLLMFNKLAQRFGGDNVGLYRDDKYTYIYRYLHGVLYNLLVT